MERLCGKMKSQCLKKSLINRKKISFIINHNESIVNTAVTVCGWIRTIRAQKKFSFIEIYDGSCFRTLQIIASNDHTKDLTTGSSISAHGKIVASPGGNQHYELQAENITPFGLCPNDYPLQKKRHSFEFLRTISHLRPRTNTQGAVARVRSHLAFSIHKFFQEKGFVYLQSPIITASDCEGAGELFQVTTLDIQSTKKNAAIEVDYTKDFFGKKTYLTVSGQLNGEAYASALSDVYTFGPTFRAENSHTSRHLAEFWMIEPEISFVDLPMIVNIAQEFLKNVIKNVLSHCMEDLKFFDKFIEKGLINRLEHVLNTPFSKVTYTEAIDILLKSKKTFEYPIKWGVDLQSEHERYLTETHFKNPVVITDYPREIKAFYMRDNDDGHTVAAMDIVVPKIGEIIGGSQREERLKILERKMAQNDISQKELSWYMDLRKFGSAPHGGFGLGFERLVQFVTGIENIRDVIAFPRHQGSCEY